METTLIVCAMVGLTVLILFACALYKDHQRFKAKIKLIESIGEDDNIPLGEKIDRLNDI